MKKNFKHVLFYLCLIAAVIIICAMLFRSDAPDRMGYSDVVAAFKQEEVREFEIDKNNVLTMAFDKDSPYAKYKTGQNKDGSIVYVEYKLASLSIFHADLGETIVDQMTPHPTVDENGNEIADPHVLIGEYVAPTEYAAWLSYLPIILVVVSLIVMYIIMTRQMSGGGAGGGKMGMGNFSKARAKMADAQAKDKQIKKLNRDIDVYKAFSNDVTVYFGAKAKALADMNRQAKAICVKALSYKHEAATVAESNTFDIFAGVEIV